MNKSVKLFLLLCVLGGGHLFADSFLARKVAISECVCEDDHSDEDFEDFFCVDETKPRKITRVQKEKASRAKVIMIRLGIKAALAGEAFYKLLRSMCAYLKSLVWHEA